MPGESIYLCKNLTGHCWVYLHNPDSIEDLTIFSREWQLSKKKAVLVSDCCVTSGKDINTQWIGISRS
jgi:hypothetical protein